MKKIKNSYVESILIFVLTIFAVGFIYVLAKHVLVDSAATLSQPESVSFEQELPETETTPEPTEPTENEKSPLLILVNKENPLPEDFFVADLTTVRGAEVSEVLTADLERLFAAAERDGFALTINSAYRSREKQARIFNSVVSDYVEAGNSRESAEEAAKQTAALPGFSEHETGLALDFSVDGDFEQKNAAWDWLGKNAHNYGFIRRYPDNKTHITGYNYEPWHYRYVGEFAEEIFFSGLVLEEYLSGI